ncbi:hypothetical protein HMPREF0972_01178 [Actinomyces sp. oral taxon 848 str. F0332]|nr:hypothetical protein HMPREF0972_01178 [Actinomyces sp. oral taxon 848 str. F0332]
MTNLRPRPDADDLTLSEEDRRELVDWAARECEDFAAQAVARACGQAIAVAHMGGHARNVERYTRKALSGPPSSPNLNGSAPRFRRGCASTSSAVGGCAQRTFRIARTTSKSRIDKRSDGGRGSAKASSGLSGVSGTRIWSFSRPSVLFILTGRRYGPSLHF